jgi:hypothetical protein
VAGTDDAKDRAAERAEREAARQLIVAYHQVELGELLEHVRDGFAQLDAGTIDEFELDDLIHRYKRSANELWKFCGSSGAHWQQAAGALAYQREHDTTTDWWAKGAPRRSRPEA